MRHLYQKIYLTIIASLLLVVLVAGAVWRLSGDRMPITQAFDMAGQLAAAALPPPSAPPESQERAVRRLRGLLPATVTSDYIYIKLFKNMPRSDVEMIFPNTKVRFRLFDKLRFGVTAGSGVGMGVVGTVGKVAMASNPFTLAAAVAGLSYGLIGVVIGVPIAFAINITRRLTG